MCVRELVFAFQHVILTLICFLIDHSDGDDQNFKPGLMDPAQSPSTCAVLLRNAAPCCQYRYCCWCVSTWSRKTQQENVLDFYFLLCPFVRPASVWALVLQNQSWFLNSRRLVNRPDSCFVVLEVFYVLLECDSSVWRFLSECVGYLKRFDFKT